MSLAEVQNTGNLMNEFQGYDHKLLARAGYRRRSLRKALISGDVEPYERDRQFRLIATLRRQARARGVPVMTTMTMRASSP